MTYEEIPGADHFTILHEMVSPTGRITTLIRQLFERTARLAVIARREATKQSRLPVAANAKLDCFASLAMTVRENYPHPDVSPPSTVKITPDV